MNRSFFAMMSAALLAVALTASIAAFAQEGGTRAAAELRANFDKALKGKTIAYLPITLAVPLTAEWKRILEEETAERGMNFVYRDPNNNPTAMLQALDALINDKPDIIIVQNPSVTLLAKELRRAEQMGIYVIQINMASNYKSSAYVGVDWRELGHFIGKEVIKECGAGSGKSGKVQIVQGELAAATSLEQNAGILEVLKDDPTIKVVSNQSARDDANNALNMTTTVLQQHPDLCASVGFWTIMESGAGKAVTNAGLQGKVKVYASGDGSQLDCDLVNSGILTRSVNYRSSEQGRQLFTVAQTLLQLGQKPGTLNLQYYTRLTWLDKTNSNGACFALAK